MLLCINSGVLEYLDKSSKHDGLHQGLDYIAYLQHRAEYDCNT